MKGGSGPESLFLLKSRYSRLILVEKDGIEPERLLV